MSPEISDAVHGKIIIPEEISIIIRNPLFERLRAIRQLGFLKLRNKMDDRVIGYSRYEHSIGTYYLALKAVEASERNTEWIKSNQVGGTIPALYRDAVLLAALLHDIGHAAFSHSWEDVDPNYDHEMMSWKLIDKIFTENCEIFPHLRDNSNYGIDLIKALITGHRKHFSHSLPTQYRFIFEIVSNKHCQIDVDKWDYLKRDGRVFGEESLTDFGDVFLNARVTEDGAHIEYLYSDRYKIIQLFTTRWIFYRDYYCQTHNITSNAIFRKIIRRNFALSELEKCYQADNFLNFTDENILSAVKNDCLTKFLNESVAYKEIPSKEFKPICEHLRNSYVDSETFHIQPVSKYFPKNQVCLYPHRGDIDTISDETIFIKKTINFFCSESDNVIYFNIKDENNCFQ
uniref:HD domain-containing protein n=1 Tax=Glossina pallidipes TaxID=7398 RepID=A0A1A9ZA30_GLOPL